MKFMIFDGMLNSALRAADYESDSRGLELLLKSLVVDDTKHLDSSIELRTRVIGCHAITVIMNRTGVSARHPNAQSRDQRRKAWE